MIVGARSALAVFLSIHVGALMDRFGTRRVTLFFVWIGICLAPVFPLVPWFWPLLAAADRQWRGAVLRVVRVADADRAARRGRCRLYRPLQLFRADRHRAAPLAAGLAWDFGGVWTAYLLGAVWGVVLTVALLRAPEAEIARARGSGGAAAVPAARRAAAPVGLRRVLRADGDPGGRRDDRDHAAAQRDQQRAVSRSISSISTISGLPAP